MPISFNEVPNAWRVPGVYVEIDNSQAMQGAGIIEYTALAAGQMLPAGTAAPLRPQLVTSAARARELFGAGSQLALMLEAFLQVNSVTRLMAIAVPDDESATAATARITFTGEVTAAAPINLYVGGVNVRCAAQAGQSAAQVAAALARAVNDDATLPVTATATEGVVSLSARNKGEDAGSIDVRLAYYGEDLPQGVGIDITPFSGGAGNPDAAEVVAAMGDAWFHIIAWPWTDRASLRALETELVRRYGPMTHIDGHAVTARAGTHADLVSFGLGGAGGGNYAHISIVENCKSPDIPWVRAARVAGVEAYYGNIDPARPFQTLELTGSLPPAEADRLTLEEQNLLLFSGIATTYADDGGVVRIQRLITNYRTTANGASDTSYLDVNTLLTLMYLRWDFRNRILRKYPRYKLADDGTPVAPGQAVITPKIGKAEAVAAYQDWLDLGLVENMDAFKTRLVCERNAQDPNRLDWLMPPDLINQFRIGAAQIQFLL